MALFVDAVLARLKWAQLIKLLTGLLFSTYEIQHPLINQTTLLEQEPDA